MSKIDVVFQRLTNKGQAALICFVVAGDPDLETSKALILKMVESGADIIELGLPYSDPLADGPVIQAASQRALQKGITLEDVFHLGEELKGQAPLIIMSYFNPIFRYGLKLFAKDCRRSGIDGVIIPDLPPEEARPWVEEARKSKLDTIFLAAPTSPPDRIKLIDRMSRGFIYFVSVTGVTGVREKLPQGLAAAVQQIKNQSPKPVAVGFGISTPEQAKEISRFADGVIVGSALAKIIEEVEGEELIQRVGVFISSMVTAVH